MTSQLPEGMTQAEIDEMAKLDRAITKAGKRLAELKEKARLGLPKHDTYVYPGGVVIVRNKQDRFQADKYELGHPYKLNPELYILKFDASKVPAEDKKKAEYVTRVETISVKIAAED